MSLKAINWMAKQTTGDDKMKSALFWLAFHLNDETGECFPSISTLQAEMEVKSDNTVRGALRRLREAGFISWERETKDGLTVKTKYHLHMDGSMAEGTSASNSTSTIAVPQPLREGASTVEGGTSTIAGGVLQPVRTNREIEQGINRERNREVMCAPSTSAKELKPRKPLVPYPETLPDEWDAAARQARPDIDPMRVHEKLKARYLPTTQRKTIGNWQKIFMDWIGREYARNSTNDLNHGTRTGAAKSFAETDYTAGIDPETGRIMRQDEWDRRCREARHAAV